MGNHFEDDYEESVEEYEDEDDNHGSNSDAMNRRIDFGRRQKPFLTPVTPYPPVYCEFMVPNRSLCNLQRDIYQIQTSSAVLRSKAIVDSDAVLREAETESDCLSDRAAALDEQKVNIFHTHFSLPYLFDEFQFLRMVPKQFTCQNVQSTDDTSEFNATVRPVIVGVCTRTLEKIFRARRSKMADPIVQ